MAIRDIRQSLSQGGMSERPEKMSVPEPRGRQNKSALDYLKDVVLGPRKTPAPSSKENTSVFGKQGHISHPQARGFIRGAKGRLYREYQGYTGKEVDQLAGKITNPERFGPYTDAKDLEKYRKEREEEIKKMTGINEKEKAKKDFKEEMDILNDVFLGKK